jgi:uncharacterized repeat protein (TIGR03803 family)
MPMSRCSAGREFLHALTMTLTLAAISVGLTARAHAQTETTLFDLQGTDDGNYPFSGVAFDAVGNLYGTTVYGAVYNCNGNAGCGAVYEISPPASGTGTWIETVLHTFTGASDGGKPYAGVVTDSSGNVYGAATSGGETGSALCKPWGCGVIFKLSPAGGGAWTETVLHSFSGARDGSAPYGTLVFDSAGNLYGTTIGGGNNTSSNCSPGGCGVVFKLTPGSAGWQETVLYAFSGENDGAGPIAGVVFDNAGNLYGTTTSEGDVKGCSCGSVFKLSPGASEWKETTLNVFTGLDGNEPQGTVAFDSAGNLYGTTSQGGPPEGCDDGCGVVYKLSPSASGPWTATEVHVFSQDELDNGYGPLGSLVLDSAGNIYGTAYGGGSFNDGIMFKMSLDSGIWRESGAIDFDGTNGGVPLGGLISDSAGNLYGTTAIGGTHNAGVVFRYTP